jgi:putative transcriptional regulator
MPYEYRESGLDNVVLRNGYSIRQTPYGETVAIHNVNALHREIARALIKQAELTGAELRFLRSELDQTQAELAKALGTSEQTVSLWERARSEPMPETPARLLRLLAADHLGLRSKPGTWLQRLAKLAEASKTVSRKTAHYERGWKLDEAA